MDDGVRVWLDGKLILDKWKLQRVTTYSGKVKLEAGRFYSLKIEYYNGPLDGIMQLMWELPKEESSFYSLFRDNSRQPISGKYLFKELPMKKPVQEQLVVQEQKVKPVAVDPGPEQAYEDLPPVSKEPVKNTVVERRTEPPAPQLAAPGVVEPAVVAPEVLEEDVYENLKPGEEVKFNHVLFEQGKYVLLEGSSAELDKLVRTMKKYPGLKIRIEGHTDNVGNPKLNHSLSFFRAKVVATYLQQQGIDLSRVEVEGFGSSKPLADNDTEEGRAKNRRVQFVVR